MDKENTNQNITPVFWDENDGKWHFTEKCLNSEFQRLIPVYTGQISPPLEKKST